MSEETSNSQNPSAMVHYVDPNMVFTFDNNAKYYKAPNGEDFCTVVDLKVKVKPRTFGVSVNDTEVEVISTNGNLGYSTIGILEGRNKVYVNDKSNGSYLTDDVSDLTSFGLVNGTKESREMFGMESVDIEYGNYFIPQVTIKFCDIRGLSMFTPEELSLNGNEIVSCFFSSFFSFPRPKFLLSVKGYYGKAVTYELNLQDFKADFSNADGSMNVIGKFIGYAYSFLNDISMNMLMTAPFTVNGKEYWETNFGENGRYGKHHKLFDMYLMVNEMRELGISSDGGGTNVSEDTINSNEDIESINSTLDGISGIMETLREFVNLVKSSCEDKNGTLGSEIDNLKEYDENGSVVSHGEVKTSFNANKGVVAKEDYRVCAYVIDFVGYPENSVFNDFLLTRAPSIVRALFTLVGIANMNGIYEKYISCLNKIKNPSVKSKFEKIIEKKIPCYGNETNNYYYDVSNAFSWLGISGHVNDYERSEIPSSNDIFENFPIGSNSNNGDRNEKDCWNDKITLVRNKNGTKRLTPLRFDFYSISEELKNEYDRINSNEYRDTVNTVANNAAESLRELMTELGVELSVSGVVESVFAHVDTLMHQLGDTCKSALGNSSERVISSDNFIDGGSNGIVPPFPKIAKKVESGIVESWLGDSSLQFEGGEELYPEIKLVNDFKNGVENMSEGAEEYSRRVNEALQNVANAVNPRLLPFNLTMPYPLAKSDWIIHDGCALGNFEGEENDIKNVVIHLVMRYVNLRWSSLWYGPATLRLKSDDFDKIGEVDGLNFADMLLETYGDYRKFDYSEVSGFVSNLSGDSAYNYLENTNIWGLLHNMGLTDNYSFQSGRRTVKPHHYFYVRDYNVNDIVKFYSVHNNGDVNNIVPEVRGGEKLVECRRYNPSNDDLIRGKRSVFDIFEGYDDSNYPLNKNINCFYDYNDNISDFLHNSDKYKFDDYGMDNGNGPLLYKRICTYSGAYDSVDKVPEVLSALAMFYFAESTSCNLYIPTYAYCFQDNDWITENINGDIFISLIKKVKEEGIFDGDNNNVPNGSYNAFVSKTDNEKETKLIEKLSRGHVLINPIPERDALSGWELTNFCKYVKGFFGSVYNVGSERVENTEDGNSGANQNMLEAGVNGEYIDEAKCSLYKYFKILYDRWLCGGLSEDETRLFDYGERQNHLYFIDQFYNKRGGEWCEYPNLYESLFNSLNAKDTTVLQFITEFLRKNQYMFFSIQNFMDLSNNTNFENAFKTYSFLDYDENPFTDFVCVRCDDPSEVINGFGRNGRPSDSFYVSNVHDFPVCITDRQSYYTIPAFGVLYGTQYQSFFKNINVGMDGSHATEPAIKTLFQIAEGGNIENGTESTVGHTTQNLFDIYSKYSYTCKVSMMGCAWIQPLMYFVLLNVPMFGGTYLIQKVTHSINGNNDMTTNITGVRMCNISNPTVRNPMFANFRFRDRNGTEYYYDYEQGELINCSENNNARDAGAIADNVDING